MTKRRDRGITSPPRTSDERPCRKYSDQTNSWWEMMSDTPHDVSTLQINRFVVLKLAPRLSLNVVFESYRQKNSQRATSQCRSLHADRHTSSKKILCRFSPPSPKPTAPPYNSFTNFVLPSVPTFSAQPCPQHMPTHLQRRNPQAVHTLVPHANSNHVAGISLLPQAQRVEVQARDFLF